MGIVSSVTNVFGWDVNVRFCEKIEKENVSKLSLLADVPPPVLNMILIIVARRSIVELAKLQCVCRFFYCAIEGKQSVNTSIQNPWAVLAGPAAGNPSKNVYLETCLGESDPFYGRLAQLQAARRMGERLRANGAKKMDVAEPNRLRESLCKIEGYGVLTILMLGLDAAGKTTLLYQMDLGNRKLCQSGVGFELKLVETENMSIISWDLGGYDKSPYRLIRFVEKTDFLVYVVDANDEGRIREARKSLLQLLNCNPDLSMRLLLVFGNKQDLPNALSSQELEDRLELVKLKREGWTYHVQSCCALTKQGVLDGLLWMHNELNHIINCK